MERICTIAFVVASVLTVLAVPVDVSAIDDWRQNAVDTTGMILTSACLFAWLLTALMWSQIKLRHYLEALVDRREKRARTQADATVRRLSIDQPTQPITVPIILRRVQ